MKVLLDECVDRRLARLITEHEVKTVSEIGWAGIKNGALLAEAAGEFDAFVTVDRNLSFQQVLSRFQIVVIVLRAPSNRLSDLKGLVPELCRVLPIAPQGAITTVPAST